MKNLKIVIGIVLGIVMVFLLAKGWYKKAEVKTESPNTPASPLLLVQANDWVLGSADAKATVVEYLDFECSACAAYFPIVTQLKETYQDRLRFVVRYFPLPMHKNSRTAAYAVEAAGKQGKFWEMYRVLFAKQAEWGGQEVANQDQFEKYAVEAGVRIDQWKKDVGSTEVKDRVEQSFQEAISRNLQGTPSFFLNGKKIENPQGYEAFKQLLDTALKE